MRKSGTVCIALGIAFLVAAASLAIRNQAENSIAEASTGRVMEQIFWDIEKAVPPAKMQGTAANSLVPDPYDPNMTEKEIDGIKYVGYLSIPALSLELPVISEWNYANLKLAPCRYYGSSKTDDLTIAAHNYECLFKTLKDVKPGDEVLFTDMDGVAIRYGVVSTEILSPAAVEDMTSGEYDLTLFTCTYNAKNRVTVRCDRKP